MWAAKSSSNEMTDSILQKRFENSTSGRFLCEAADQILVRDNWRCQICGALKNLDVHHLRRLSALGDDTESNLITLCRKCHRALHGFIGPARKG